MAARARKRARHNKGTRPHATNGRHTSRQRRALRATVVASKWATFARRPRSATPRAAQSGTLSPKKNSRTISNTRYTNRKHLSSNKPHDTGRHAGTKNAHAPRYEAHATLTRQTIAHRRPHAQPHQGRQHGKTRHAKGKGRADEQIRRARSQMLYLHVAGQDKYTITCKHASSQPDNTRAGYATRGSLNRESNHATRQCDDSAIPCAHQGSLTITVR